ncbi:IS701 family transposase [Streptomyces sp. NPDC057617]|uniref:IS701 family transposase n=1 Tax=Streptomyces sp. NPDC057617 TaxID=3346184 RepID=UPI0036CBB67B
MRQPAAATHGRGPHLVNKLSDSRHARASPGGGRRCHSPSTGVAAARLVLQLQFAIVAGQEPVSECSELTVRHLAGVRDRRCSIDVVLIVQDDVCPDVWAGELDEALLRVGHRFGRADLRRRMRDYVRALLGPVGRKNSWQLAEYAGHSAPHGFQNLLNRALWDVDSVRDDVQAYVAERLGEPDGVLVIDETGFLKKGDTSAGVQRQYSGTAGRTENCQVAVFAAYASRRGRTLVDRELYLPKSWTSDREQCRAAKVPDSRGFATKTELARTLVARALASPLPISWVTTDALYGQDWHFRRMLEEAGLGYVVAVPKSQQIKSLAGCWRIDQLIGDAPDDAWERLSCGDGANGPRLYDWAAAMAAKGGTERGPQKRICSRAPHPGRNPKTHGNLPPQGRTITAH